MSEVLISSISSPASFYMYAVSRGSCDDYYAATSKPQVGRSGHRTVAPLVRGPTCATEVAGLER